RLERLRDGGAKVPDLVKARGFVELALEILPHAPHRAGEAADLLHDGGQFLGTDDDQRHDADHKHLSPADTEHGEVPYAPSASRVTRPGGQASFFSVSRVSTGALASSVLGFSSSFKPFWKAL